MMNSNNASLERVATDETSVENGKDSKQSLSDNDTFKRRFGLMDLWKIRNSARSYRIHSRISRV